jgi:hypothetical protein
MHFTDAPSLYLHSASGYLKYSTLPNTTTAAHCSLRSSSATRESRCKLRVNNRTLALKRSNAKALNKALCNLVPQPPSARRAHIALLQFEPAGTAALHIRLPGEHTGPG